jgi:hypothetical protein
MTRDSLFLMACILSLIGTAPLAAEERVDYMTQIKPLLESKCYSCHGALKQEGQLRLETLSLMTKGGDSGPAVVAKHASESLILHRVTAEEDSRMPPVEDGASLKPDEIALLRNWITQGADAPVEEIPLAPSEHWAFLKIEKPVVPPSTEFTNPIDILLAARRSQQGLKTQPKAERTILIRRLYLDLIGLPPSLEQLHDKRPWEEIVEGLLKSPHHGERWGRHWMDVWRYTEWYGLGTQLRNSQKHMWHWRDWIVNSLNSDKGYDRMIQEMIAGDELAPDDPDAIAATGFLARNYYLFNRTTWLDSTIEHTGKAFLGLTLNCAKCHDHKYDPITHEDYYSFRAIFEPHQVRLDPVPGVTNFETDGLPRVFDDHPDAETFLHVRGNPMEPDKETKITPRVPALLASFQPDITPVALPPEAYAPGIRDYVQKDHLKAAESAVLAAKKRLAAARKVLANLPQKANTAATATEFTFADDFQTFNPEAWEIVGDGWQYKDGSLHQTRSTRDTEFVRLKQSMARNFDVTCRYTTTGGDMYKSVMFRFDQSRDRKYSNFVYSSAHSPGPKVQVAYTRDGSATYPSDGRSARPVKVGEPCELRFAVRDQLVNVWFNGEFAVACLLPDRRPTGYFALSGFDATVAFDSIKIQPLAQDVELVAPENAAAQSSEDAAIAVTLAETKLHALQLQQKSLQATIAADLAKFGQSDSDDAAQAAKTAATLQAEAMRAESVHDLLAAGRDTKKAAAAKAQAKTADQKLVDVEKGIHDYAGIRASRKALEGPIHKETDYASSYTSTSTGRRLSLSRWMTHRDNPLTARVAVNHVWMRHFGKPLVESVFDLGLRTKKPLHADLLDFLAAEFMDVDWSFRHLHRLIVTSQAYQLSSAAADADAVARDPANQSCWRMNVRRMEAQIVRDSLLHLAGTLDPALGGPSQDVDKNSNRRSLYLKHSRDQHDKFLTMFDDADLLQCYRRSESIVPQQALALANSRLAMTISQKIAKAVSGSLHANDQSSFVDVAFETLLSRPPTADEHTECLTFCDELTTLLEKDIRDTDLIARVRTRLIHSLLNHNDFISIR